MNLADLKDLVDGHCAHAGECGYELEDVEVSVQFEYSKAEDGEIWTRDVEVIFDCDGQASGCVIVASEEVAP